MRNLNSGNSLATKRGKKKKKEKKWERSIKIALEFDDEN
jgi:hypothetical protein